MAFKLNSVINAMRFPCSGNDVLNKCATQNLPERFISELRPLIRNKKFESKNSLESWFADNMTAHMAGLLGGAAVQDLIRKGKQAA